MTDILRDALLTAGRLSRSGSLLEATRELQRAFSGTAPDGQPAVPAADDDVIDVVAREVPETEPASAPAAQGWQAPPDAPAPGSFSGGDFANQGGRRAYKLFRPTAAPADGRAPALVVMLHGCEQNPDDFARGTRMNDHAERLGWWILYPQQDAAANGMGCWNWFNPADQSRAGGEPEILAGMTQSLVTRFGLDPQRVFVAGLSAGGAMAATLATTHPEIFSALGVHSGLPHGSASDLLSAMSAMRLGAASRSAPHRLPTIVFHGDQDTTVHPSNGDEVIRQARDQAGVIAAATPEPAPCPAGSGALACTRWLHRAPDGRIDAEHWLVHGSGHAWSGGSSAGSYTDPAGPDASAEMLRFFDQQRPVRY